MPDDLPIWRRFAACKGADLALFFPAALPRKHEAYRPRKGPDPYRHGRELCAVCPVREACLQAAIERHEEDGLWGGLDPIERWPLVIAYEEQARPERLAERRRHAGRLAARGLPVRSIAELLDISIPVVRKDLRSLRRAQ